MLSQNERKRIIALINREVVPAIGCTEPIAVALCTARAAELLGSQSRKGRRAPERQYPQERHGRWASPVRG